MIDTNKFLEMVGEIGGAPNVAALDKLKIPRFEIGRTDLAGNIDLATDFSGTGAGVAR